MPKANGLTEKQRAFCDFYIESKNATDAARRAGYAPKTAGSIGAENLKKPQIIEFIALRLHEIESSRIATITEILQFYTAVMRGEISDRNRQAKLEDRLSAADALLKRLEVTEIAAPDDAHSMDPLTQALMAIAEDLDGNQ